MKEIGSNRKFRAINQKGKYAGIKAGYCIMEDISGKGKFWKHAIIVGFTGEDHGIIPPLKEPVQIWVLGEEDKRGIGYWDIEDIANPKYIRVVQGFIATDISPKGLRKTLEKFIKEYKET